MDTYITGCAASPNLESGAKFIGTPVSVCNEANKCNNQYGIHASTTDDISGTYDMSGGAWEVVMANMVDQEGYLNPSYANFTTLDTKYYDIYAYGTTDIDHERGHLGDATREILKLFGAGAGGWYNDISYFSYGDCPWFNRGGRVANGYATGIFGFVRDGGNANDPATFRVALTAQDGAN